MAEKATPNLALPYFEGADPADGAVQQQALAQKLDGIDWPEVTRPPVVASLPSDPSDRDEIHLWTGQTFWHLMYWATHVDQYKWVFLGGPSHFSEVSPTYVIPPDGNWHFATSGPNIVVPFAGEYLLTASALLTTSVPGGTVYMAYQGSGVNVADADALYARGNQVGQQAQHQGSRTLRRTFPATTLSALAKAGGSTGEVALRSFRLDPIRVG